MPVLATILRLLATGSAAHAPASRPVRTLPCLARLVAVLAFATAPVDAQRTMVTFTVTDETGIAVAAARITVTAPQQRSAFCETDFAGRCQLPLTGSGPYTLVAQKPGFYRLAQANVNLSSQALDITLLHEQEVRETVDVVESPPTIDPAQTAATENLDAREILNVPYPTSRDVRNALPLMPQVVRDLSGNIHVAGASITHTLNMLDGFNVTDPSGGADVIHVNTDAVRTIEALSTRYSTQFGKGNSVLGFTTRMGDDRLRFTATNFMPSFQLKKGLTFDKWVPRFTLSGPLVRGRAWFLLAPDAEYQLTVVRELPEGADRGTLWRVGNLAKAQVNLTSANILSGEFLFDDTTNRRFGLSRFTPVESTLNLKSSSYFAAVRDQHYFSSGFLLEAGFAAVNYNTSFFPRGSLPYIITPDASSGSFFRSARAERHRNQLITNVYAPPVSWQGRHELRAGGSVDFVSLDDTVHRNPVQFQRRDGTLERRVEFGPPRATPATNTESALYVEDRWTPAERLLIQPGIRIDHDSLLQDTAASPRIGATYALAQDTKLSAGIGLYRPATNLDFFSRGIAAERSDTFFAPDGTTPTAVVRTAFNNNGHPLLIPRFVSWGVSIERKLPFELYGAAAYVEKRGQGLFAYANLDPRQTLGDFVLENARTDRYRAFEFSVRRTFKNVYPLLVSYTRSRALTSALLVYSPDMIATGTQMSGSLPWDAPNRLVSWGWLPFIKGFTIGYSIEARDGFPFVVVNETQQVVPMTNTQRFPRYFNAAVSAERRFHVLGYFLALRGTLDNVTNRRNPNVVNSNISSPLFRSFSSLEHRTFNLRIRFLGRSKKASDKPPAKPAQRP